MNRLNAALAAALLAMVAAVPAEATVFNFNFDATFDATVSAPYVGSGTFSFDGPAMVGTYALTSLSNYAFDFTLNGIQFTNTDLATPVANISVAITLAGTDLLVNFGGTGGGPFNGSVDFVKGGGGLLTLQPGFGPLYQSDTGSSGTYQGVSAISTVPEPMSVALLAIGLAGITAARRRRRRA